MRTAQGKADLSPHRWPHTVKHLCFSLNISLIDGACACDHPHGKGHLSGSKIPFGSLMGFRPPKVLLKDFTKFSKATMPGVMLGYHVGVG
eukprot:12341974-Heterocapsa_arctica.AAC.1